VIDPIYIWNQSGSRAYTWRVSNGWQSNVQQGREIFVNSGAKPGYSKYIYPHPFRGSGSSAGGSGGGGGSTTALQAPSNLRIVQ
jgi:hypothetical protein